MAAPMYEPLNFGFNPQRDLQQLNSFPMGSIQQGYDQAVKDNEIRRQQAAQKQAEEANQLIGAYLQSPDTQMKDSASQLQDISMILAKYGQVDGALKMQQSALQLKQQEQERWDKQLGTAVNIGSKDPNFGKQYFDHYNLGQHFPEPNFREMSASTTHIPGEGYVKLYGDGTKKVLYSENTSPLDKGDAWINIRTGATLPRSQLEVLISNGDAGINRNEWMKVSDYGAYSQGSTKAPFVYEMQQQSQNEASAPPPQAAKPFYDPSKSNQEKKKKVISVIQSGLQDR